MELQGLVIDVYLSASEAEEIQSKVNEFGQDLNAQEIGVQELQKSVALVSANIKELPKIFESGKHTPSVELEMRITNYLGLQLNYLFKDGMCIGFDKVLFHTRVKQISNELLPLKRSVWSADADLESLYWKSKESRASDLCGDWEFLFLRILKNAQKMVVNRRLQVWLRPVVVGVDALGIKNKTFLKPLQAELMDFNPQQKNLSEADGAVLCEVVCEKSGDILNLGRVSIKTEGLTQTKDRALIKNFTFGFEKKVLGFRRATKGFNINAMSSIIEGHKEIAKAIAELRKAEQDSHIRFLLNPGTEDLAVGEYHPKLDISAGDRLGVSFLVQETGKKTRSELHNPFLFRKVVEDCLREGFQSLFLEAEQSLIAVGARRVADLTFIRHSGLYAFFIYEFIRYVREGVVDKKTVIKEEIKESLYKKIPAVAFTGSPVRFEGEPLTAVCSQRVLQKLDEHVDWLWELIFDKTVDFYSETGEYRLQRANFFYFDFLNTLIAQVIVSTSGECFRKARLKFTLFGNDEAVVEKAPVVVDEKEKVLVNEVTSFALYSNVLRKNYAFNGLFELRNSGWKIFYNDRPVEAIGEKEFRSEIKLNEKGEITGVEKVADSKAGKIDWFELHPKFFVNGKEIELEQAMQLTGGGLIELDGHYYLLDNHNLPNVRVLEKFWQKLVLKQGEKGKKEKRSPIFYLSKNQSLDLLALRASGVIVDGGKEWKRVCEFYDSMGSSERQPELPTTLQGELKPYQKSGLLWIQDLYNLRMGGILADDMGLGKTFQTLAFLENLRMKKELGHVLIIVPTTLTYTWIQEVKKFTPDLPLAVFEGKSRAAAEDFLFQNEHGILICTYGLFVEHEEFFAARQWSIHIYDEAQNLKNILTKRTTAARKVPSRFKMCLTGTPLENHLGEFYSLLDLAVPGSLGEYSDFRKTFLGASVEQDDMKYLKLKVRPLVLRRTKSQILKELPPKIETVNKIPFEEKQKEIYRDVALSWNQKVKESITQVGESRSQLIMLTALLRLRQVCSDPGALPGVKYSQTPPKISLLMDSIHEIIDSGESVIVFTQFIHTLERLSHLLQKENVPLYTMTGTTTSANRQKLLQNFNDHQGGAVLLMTLKTGGVGLNLTKASYVFHLEPWWNPAAENQATDRVHRIGQTRSVQVYRYLMEDSVEEKIELLKARKSAQFKAIFDDVESEAELSSSALQLSREDFEYLLS